MNEAPTKSTQPRQSEGAPEYVTYVTKQVIEKTNPDSIEYGKSGARVKVYGDLDTEAGTEAIREKLLRALDCIAAADAKAGE